MPVDAPYSYWRIEFYTTDSGRSPVRDYIDALPSVERAHVRNSLRLLGEFGTQLGMPHVRQIRDSLWELRSDANRLLYFADTGHTLVVLHAFRKQSAKTPKQEIETALRRLSQY